MYEQISSVLQNRWIQALGAFIALVLAAVLFYLISPLLTPVFLALLAAYLLDPVVDWFERHGVRRGITAGALGFLTALILVSIPLFVVPRMFVQAEELVASARAAARAELNSENQEPTSRIEQWLSPIESWLNWLPLRQLVLTMGWDQRPVAQSVNVQIPGALAPAVSTVPRTEPVELDLREKAGLAPEQGNATSQRDPEIIQVRSDTLSEEQARVIVAQKISEAIQQNLREVVQAIAGTTSTGGNAVAGLFAALWRTFVTFLSFLVNFSVFAFCAGYLLVGWDGVVSTSRRLVPVKYRPRTFSIMAQINQQLRGFVRGQLTVALCLAVIYTIGLAVVARVPFGMFIGIFAGLGSFIPYLGPLMGFSAAIVMVLVKYGFGMHLIAVLATFVVAQSAEEFVLKPLVLGGQVGLHPVWVMSAFLVFGHAFGFLGVILAVPIAAILKVLVVEAFETYVNSNMYRRESAGEDP